ncbi:MAG: DUF4194 domain-containing protein [Bacilli bacterium]|jgi:hypothetical protein|nr:DUF4194 domain-containing protein [Bacilli bacterium]
MFDENYEKLTRANQNEFGKAVSELLFHCYIVRKIYDRASKINKISSTYLFIEAHYDLVSEYLDYIGIQLNKDDDAGVIFISSPDEINKIRIDSVTTLVIYALRSYYEGKIASSPNTNEVYCDSTSLKILLKDLGVTSVSRRFSTNTLASAMRTLAMYQIVCIAQGSFSDTSWGFYILPSIRYVISNAKLNALYNSIKEISPLGVQAPNGLDDFINQHGGEE